MAIRGMFRALAREDMLDLVFLAVGGALFALFGLYGRGLRAL